jgi:hypothetical protein
MGDGPLGRETEFDSTCSEQAGSVTYSLVGESIQKRQLIDTAMNDTLQ